MNSAGENGQDGPGGSHSSAAGAEPSVPCGKEPEVSKSSCVRRVAEGGGQLLKSNFISAWAQIY